ncbi:hypothetical protein J1792_31685 [Streptomyces triculaminicus]|uniref:Uncharacterized protein n=2 Tax=Streptomyces TaxID=1883 RepID=A0A939FUU6_9ACTN|nr:MULTISPECIES: hypothetical protein [Streptomyces]MBO0657123.1 hypothetical protein [Streptomyces triculaminicus]QSY49490.1 hypothetical protein J3S04_32105 [Streptomyces griseocarneus]
MNAPDIGTTLLDYDIISEPFPLYAGTADAPSTTVHLVVSNGRGDTVYCREIIFSLPHGDLAQSLVDTTSGDGEASADGWSVKEIQKGADIVVPDGDYAHFVAKAPEGGAPVDASGITITLKNLTVSKQPGVARVEVRETATLDTGNWPDSPGFRPLTITKFPPPVIPVRAVSDFRADKLEVASGDPVCLTWDGPPPWCTRSCTPAVPRPRRIRRTPSPATSGAARSPGTRRSVCSTSPERRRTT